MLMKSPDQYETFGPSDREYIANMIDHYLAGTVPDDYEDRERFLTDCECGFWLEETENGYEARVRIEYLTREAFEANPQLAIDIVWDDLVRWMYCHVLGVHYLEVIGDWRPDKLEYLRAVIADRASKGDTIVYIDWPDGVEKPVAGPTMNEFITQRGKAMDAMKANDRNGTPAQKAVTAITYRPVMVGEWVTAGDRGNRGTVERDYGEDCDIHFVSPDGNQATKRIPKTDLSLLDGTPLAERPMQFPKVRTFSELAAEFPKLRHPVIDGVIRKGETANLISVSKVGKSWLVGDLALSVLTGRAWLNSFDVDPGDVLILDNELHPETLSYRIEKIATARMIPRAEYEHLKVVSFRGQLVDIFALQSFFSQFEAGELQLVIIDALYRFMPDGIDENSNAGITKIYNQLDRIAAQLDCAIVCVHHASKGNQSGKAVVDVGSGAGAQSRATDAHLVLRPHKEDGAVVLEAACRSWPPITPRVLRWNWPVWELADDLNASDLKSERGQKGSRAADVEAMKTSILETFIHFPDGATKTDVRNRVGQGKVFDAAWLSVCNCGDVEEHEIKKGNNRTFSGFKRVYKSDDSDF